MHIPDGFLNAPVAISTAVLAGIGFGYAAHRAGRELPSRRAPLLGVSAAFIFSAQMLNFPVVAGASGHPLGAAMASILLGPAGAVVVMTAVAVLQCLLFADGGITALGANVLNMAVLGAIGAAMAHRIGIAIFPRKSGHFSSAFFAGWASTVLAAMACAGQLSLSGKSEAKYIFPALVGVYALIGVGEGLVTAMVVTGIQKARPELLAEETGAQFRIGSIVVFALLVSLTLAIFVSPFACSWPDGLENTAEKLGFHTNSITPILPALMPDYSWGDAKSGWSSALVVGISGTIGAFLLTVLVLMVLSRLRAKPAAAEE